MKKLAFALITMSLLLSGTALASDKPSAAHNGTSTSNQHKKSRPKFEDCDKDKDGALTLQEAQACYPRIASKFDAIDTNKDGKITKEEMKAHRAARKKSKAAAQ